MQPQHLDVGDPQPRVFDPWHDLGDRRGIAAGEDVFAQPWIGRTGAVAAADRMQQGDAVRFQQVAYLSEKSGILADPDMLEHADRDDAVVLAVFFAIVAQMETHAVAEP